MMILQRWPGLPLDPVNVLSYMVKGTARVIKLRILRWRNCLGLHGWYQCSYKLLYKRRAGEAASERKHWKMLSCWP